jgi:hypothetical protein
MQRRMEGGRGFLIAVRTRDICGVDRRCCAVVHSLVGEEAGGYIKQQRRSLRAG